jgi:hypothetical protein
MFLLVSLIAMSLSHVPSDRIDIASQLGDHRVNL